MKREEWCRAGRVGWGGGVCEYLFFVPKEQIRKLIRRTTGPKVMTINATFHRVHNYSIWHSFTHGARVITQIYAFILHKTKLESAFHGPRP